MTSWSLADRFLLPQPFYSSTQQTKAAVSFRTSEQCTGLCDVSSQRQSFWSLLWELQVSRSHSCFLFCLLNSYLKHLLTIRHEHIMCLSHVDFTFLFICFDMKYSILPIICDNEGEKMGMNNLKSWLIQVLGVVRSCSGYWIQKFGKVCIAFHLFFFFQLSQRL
jgi:hypothetical protein